MDSNEDVKYLKVGEIALLFGVSPQTVRNFEFTKGFKPDRITDGGTRFYKEETVRTFLQQAKRGV